MPVADEPISDEIRRFVLHCLPTVPHLEALLLLSAGYPSGERWTVALLAGRLYLSERSTAAALTDLAEVGLLECVDAEALIYRYAPRSQELAIVVQKLAEAYAKRLIEVTKLIHSTTGRKAQQFADAFRWRKK